jgi:eukaryotic-like serine/threonine-protein kinase
VTFRARYSYYSMEPYPMAMPQYGSVIGRYVLYDEIAAGGMATVCLGRLRGERGFKRTVAIKRLLPELARDPEFVSMFVDEALLAARIQHPNVVAPLDVVTIEERELLLVMEYVHGEALSRLVGNCRRAGRPIPADIAVSVMSGVLYGLHAAHEASSDQGLPLDIVHRDVSPQNILVGADGVARVLDFGIAKASVRANITRDGMAKGKLSYMSPEQIHCESVDRRTDLFAAGVVLWEMLTLKRLFTGNDEAELRTLIAAGSVPRASEQQDGIPPELDAVLARALAPERSARFPTAYDFAVALEAAVVPATARKVAEWVNDSAGDGLAERSALLQRIEAATLQPTPTPDPARGRSGIFPPVSRPTARAAFTEVAPSEVERAVARLDERPAPPPAQLPLRRARRRQGISPIGRRRLTVAAAILLGAVGMMVILAMNLSKPEPVPRVAARAPAPARPPAPAPAPPAAPPLVAAPISAPAPLAPVPAPTGPLAASMVPAPAGPAGGAGVTGGAGAPGAEVVEAPPRRGSRAGAAGARAQALAERKAADRRADRKAADRKAAAAERKAKARARARQVAAQASKAAQRRAVAVPEAQRPKPAAPAARPRCNPPYVVDERGIRRIKPECLSQR